MNSATLKTQRCTRTESLGKFVQLAFSSWLFHCPQREICEAKCITTNHFALLTRLDAAARESLHNLPRAKHTWLQLGAATLGLGPPLGRVIKYD